MICFLSLAVLGITKAKDRLRVSRKIHQRDTSYSKNDMETEGCTLSANGNDKGGAVFVCVYGVPIMIYAKGD